MGWLPRSQQRQVAIINVRQVNVKQECNRRCNLEDLLKPGHRHLWPNMPVDAFDTVGHRALHLDAAIPVLLDGPDRALANQWPDAQKPHTGWGSCTTGARRKALP
jgi:hypothetical protein